MKKSMLAATVVATAFAASANAGWFTVTSASGTNSGGNTTFTTPQTLLTGGSMGLRSVTGNTGKTLTAAEFTAVNNIGFAANTLTYFSFQEGGLGYFGVAYNNTGAATNFNVNLTGSNNTDGVFSGSRLNSAGAGGAVTAFGSYNAGTRQFSSTGVSVGTNETWIAVYAGLVAGGSGTVSGSVADTNATNFAISYLSWNGASWNAYTPAGTYYNSNLNVATYAVPVPAPALLAGAGLVGAAALRRRMAKKA